MNKLSKFQEFAVEKENNVVGGCYRRRRTYSYSGSCYDGGGSTCGSTYERTYDCTTTYQSGCCDTTTSPTVTASTSSDSVLS